MISTLRRAQIRESQGKVNLRPALSSDVAGLLTDTDADTDTATVNRVETFEFRSQGTVRGEALLTRGSVAYPLSFR